MRMTISLFCTLLATACASSQATKGTAATTPSEERAQVRESGARDDGNDEAASACPMRASGTTVTAEDVEGGAALRFTTTGDVADLRDRLQRMAEMHNRHARGGMHPMRGRSEMMSPAMMQAEARVEAVEGGARLKFTPADPDQVAGLRDAVRQRAERMATSGQCPMMAQMAGRRGGMDMEGMAGMCPMKVDGTTATSEDVEGGVALRFTTTGDVAELQRRVAAMAEMHTRRGAMMRRGQGMSSSEDDGHEQQERMQGHGMHGQHHGGMMRGAMMQAEARAENVEGGAQLVFTPRDADKLAALRQQVRTHAERMSSGQCPMMSMHGGSQPGDSPTGEGE